jgi:methionyl aminopeptidase
MVEYKTPGEIDAMHAAGQVVARILAAVRSQAAPGVRLSELDQTARDVLAEARASSPFLGYQPSSAHTPFPAVICASVNDAVLHDIPGRYRLADGDLLSIDCGATASSRDWSSPSSPGSWPEARTRTRSTPTAGPSAAPTAAAPPTSSTPLPSPTTGRSSSPRLRRWCLLRLVCRGGLGCRSRLSRWLAG